MTRTEVTVEPRSSAPAPPPHDEGGGARRVVTARLAGMLYLVIIACGLFAEVAVRSRLIERDDAAATARNLVDSEALFRVAFAADLIVFLCDVALAVVLLILFEPLSRALSLLAAAFRLTQTAIIGLNLLGMFAALLLLTDATYARAFASEQADAVALYLLDLHAYGYVLGLTFFGVSTAAIGCLTIMSPRMPSVLGWILVVAGAGYVADSAMFFLIPDYDGGASPIVLAPALIGEVWLCVWLLVRGGGVTDLAVPARQTSRLAEARG